MLRITQSESATAARTYFGQSLTRGDYYLEGQEIAGHWGGKAAERLGLRGEVEKEAFERLLENEKPNGDALTSRKIENRRPGYDFTFDVPKSVSILHLLSGDERITAAMRRAIQETMSEMELEMHARVRKSGAFSDRKTGNMVWADFIHLTSRPAALPQEVEAELLRANPALKKFRGKNGRLYLPDPHLHAHVFVMNATFDEVEGIWKAGEFMRLKRDATYYQAVYHTRLAVELQRLGYTIEPTANAFEIAGVVRSVVEAFSRRTKEVEAAAKKLGIVTAEMKDLLGVLTRHSKAPDLGMRDLKRLWRNFLLAPQVRELDNLVKAAKAKGAARVIDDRTKALSGIEFALGHELERASEVREKRLLARALARSIGFTTVETVRSALRSVSNVLFANIEGERHLTTKEVLAEESELAGIVRKGRGQCLPLVAGRYKFTRPELSDDSRGTREQRAAVEHLLKSRDWVVGLVGKAGTGKTTLLKEMGAAIAAVGRKIVITAPSAEASRGVLRAEGFERAETVKLLLSNPSLHAELRGGILWVDEAGMVGNSDMLALLRLAKKEGAARVILSGDAKQIRSVSRGDSFLFLEEKAGLSIARLDTIRRQRTPELKTAVEAISRGNVAEGLVIMGKAGKIREGNVEELNNELAKAYADKIAEVDETKRRKTALVISPTHAEGERVTEAIRTELKARKVIEKKEHRVKRTVNLSWTEKQRSNPASYEPGLLIQFKQNASGFRKSERARVTEVNTRGGKVEVLTNRGETVELPLKEAARWQVYAVKNIPVSVGDSLKITENGYEETGRFRVTNGDLVRVKGFTKEGGIIMHNDRVLPPDFGHLTHGYVITADSAQSKTVDAVYLAIGEESLSAMDMRRFYVMLSRAREDAYIYTEDERELLTAAKRDSVRRSGTEIIGQERARLIVEEMQREQSKRITVERAIRPGRQRMPERDFPELEPESPEIDL